MRRAVVGVDDAPAARHALCWAIDEARRRGAVVHLVHAVRAPLTRTDEGLLERSSTARQAADDVLRRTLRACSDAAAGVEIITQALPGRPGPVLAQAAEGAELLVLGDSEAGLVRVSGSVTDYCIRNSPCPIVVVPSGRLLASA